MTRPLQNRQNSFMAVRLLVIVLGVLGLVVAQAQANAAPADREYSALPAVKSAQASAPSATAPGATSTDNGARLDVFSICNTNHLCQNRWTQSGGWSGWKDLGTAPVASPVSATWQGNNDRLDVFITSTTTLYQKYWTLSDGWSGWIPWAGPPGGFGTFASATWAANGSRLDVFAFNSSVGFYQKYWTPSGGWSSWIHL